MSLALEFETMHQSWTGTSKLHLPWLEGDQKIFESESTLQINTCPLGKTCIVTYTWSHDGENHTGYLMFALDPTDELTGAWMDSWHQNAAVLFMKGPKSDSAVALTGSYPAPEGPDWGWRIELNLYETDFFQMRMTNIMPGGEEEWAVEANYKPAP